LYLYIYPFFGFSHQHGACCRQVALIIIMATDNQSLFRNLMKILHTILFVISNYIGLNITLSQPTRCTNWRHLAYHDIAISSIESVFYMWLHIGFQHSAIYPHDLTSDRRNKIISPRFSLLQ
jgi:hypothetical protein